MPKYRKLYVKTVESLDINDMPDDFTRLMWVLLPLGLCREGRGPDNPAWVKSKLFPMRLDVTVQMISGAMNWYESRGMIVRYQVCGRAYFYVPTFHKYQGDTQREAESDYPPPPDENTENSRPTHDQLTTVLCSDADSDADANTQESGEAPAADAAPVGASIPSTFQEWQVAVQAADPKHRQVVLRNMHIALYPGMDPPDYGYVGRIARQVGGAGRLAELMWQHSTRPPTGDVLAYLLKVHQGKERDNGHGSGTKQRKLSDAPVITSIS